MPLLIEIVPRLAIVLATLSLVIAAAKDLFSTQLDASGPVPLPTYVFVDTRAELFRRMVPKVTLYALGYSVFAAVMCILAANEAQIDFRWRGAIVSFPNAEVITSFMNWSSLGLVVAASFMTHLLATAQRTGQTAAAL